MPFYKKTKYGYEVTRELCVYYREFQKYYIDTTYLQIKNGYIIIKKGFKCDGCSMSPDFKKAIRACIIHDALYKYLKNIGKGALITRKQADGCFKFFMKQDGFKLRCVYFRAVRVFGGIHNIFRKKDKL